MVNKRLAAAPVAKSVSGYDNADLDVLRSSVDFTSDAARGATFQFFPGNASDSEVSDNYIENPLPTSNAHDVLGIGFELQPTITSESDFDVIAAHQALTNAYVELSTSERQTLIQVDAAQVVEIENHDLEIDGDAANDTFDVSASANGQQAAIRLPDPITIESQEVFDLELETALPGQLPSAADYTTISGGVAQIVAYMEVAQ